MMAALRYRKPLTLDELHHYHHAVIEASAGTGKTYTMEHLVVDLLLGADVTIEEILVVTFTERATGELKARIRTLLERIIRACERGDAGEEAAGVDEPHWELTEEAREKLKAALSAFDVAPIYTIHGFCQRILTEHAFQNRRLFDEEHVDAHALFDEVFAEALRRDFASREDLLPYLAAWMETQSSPVDSLRDLLSRCVTSRAVLRPHFDEPALLTTLEVLVRQPSEPMLDELRDHLKQAKVHGGTSKAILGRVGPMLEIIADWKEHRSSPRVLANLQACDTKYLVEKVDVLAKGGSLGAALIDVLEAAVPLRAAIAQRMTALINQRLREKKDAQGVFSFDDMLSMVWESMENDSGELVTGLRKRYRYGLIDEFQDTDDLQWKIFRRLFFESKLQSILYLIGDPKQAIYSFRGADVHTYLSAREEVRADGGNLVRLEENFRSTGPMIAAYNHIFDQEAKAPFFTGAIDYTHPVRCGRPGLNYSPGEDIDPAPIQLIELVPREGQKLRAHGLRHGLARQFAREIRRVLEAGAALGEEGEKGRAIAPRNVFVLTQKASEGQLLGEYLRAEGVPFAFYKQDGLFQTPEARDILEVLSAVEDPYDRARRLRAWLTPFFRIPLKDLVHLDPLEETDPLFSKLAAWSRLGEQRRFDELFAHLLEESDLIRREIFFKESERELTNYLHIFEILLDEASRRRVDLGGLVARLQAFIEERALPEGEDGNVQRLESERDAVQIMTMHKSKGLEADVVFVYGGFTAFPDGGLYTFHLPDGRRVMNIDSMSVDEKELHAQESAEEEQRLLYVALTRARGQIYLPYVSKKDYGIKGCLAHVNDRLEAIVEGLDRGEHTQLFKLRRFLDVSTSTERDSSSVIDTYTWRPPEELLVDASPVEDIFAAYHARHLIVTSYSRLKASGEGYRSPLTVDEFRGEALPKALEALGEDALPGGVASGNFLHQIIEEIDLGLVLKQENLTSWLEDPEVDAHYRPIMARFGIEERHVPYSKEVIYRTLSTPVHIDSEDQTVHIEKLAACDPAVFELEFLYPIPEDSHPRLGTSPSGALRVERGYIKGFIDFVFEHEGKVYFADWKSDILDDYEPHALGRHIASHYGIQAKLYSLAMVKTLAVQDEALYDEQFGGFFYFFIRGIGRGGPKTGVFFQRPTWAELKAYEEELIMETEYK